MIMLFSKRKIHQDVTHHHLEVSISSWRATPATIIHFDRWGFLLWTSNFGVPPWLWKLPNFITPLDWFLFGVEPQPLGTPWSSLSKGDPGGTSHPNRFVLSIVGPKKIWTWTTWVFWTSFLCQSDDPPFSDTKTVRQPRCCRGYNHGYWTPPQSIVLAASQLDFHHVLTIRLWRESRKCEGMIGGICWNTSAFMSIYMCIYIYIHIYIYTYIYIWATMFVKKHAKFSNGHIFFPDFMKLDFVEVGSQ